MSIYPGLPFQRETKKKREPVRIREDGREVLDLKTAKGRKMWFVIRYDASRKPISAVSMVPKAKGSSKRLHSMQPAHDKLAGVGDGVAGLPESDPRVARARSVRTGNSMQPTATLSGEGAK